MAIIAGNGINNNCGIRHKDDIISIIVPSRNNQNRATKNARANLVNNAKEAEPRNGIGQFSQNDGFKGNMDWRRKSDPLARSEGGRK